MITFPDTAEVKDQVQLIKKAVELNDGITWVGNGFGWVDWDIEPRLYTVAVNLARLELLLGKFSVKGVIHAIANDDYKFSEQD